MTPAAPPPPPVESPLTPGFALGIEGQSALFAPLLRRTDLLRLAPPAGLEPLRIRVHRNHAFEAVTSIVPQYLALRHRKAEFGIGDYDDSLAFQALDAHPDAHADLLWLDYSRYFDRLQTEAFGEWIVGRLATLVARTGKPAILVNWSERPAYSTAVDQALSRAALPGIRSFSTEAIGTVLGKGMYDERIARLSGSRLTEQAILRLARELGCRWIPAATLLRIKAVAVDLDHTLYEGVLGEDGIDGVRLTAEHRRLQDQLLALRDQGVFLALVSRNEEADVQALFRARADFPLRWEHFSAHHVSWGPKPGAIASAAGSLRIGADAVVFVDDNPGELAAVASALPRTPMIWASDAAATARALEYFPGLWASHVGEADQLRVADLEANGARAALESASVDPAAYLRSLGVVLRFGVNSAADVPRIHELSQKTNQFNLALRRFEEADLRHRLERPQSRVVTIRLRDRLSDSGLIGFVSATRDGDRVAVDELCISCRALGRSLEDLMVGGALSAAGLTGGNRRFWFDQVEGPRNAPARDWLRRVAGPAYSAGAPSVEVPASVFESAGAADNIVMENDSCTP